MHNSRNGGKIDKLCEKLKKSLIGKTLGTYFFQPYGCDVLVFFKVCSTLSSALIVPLHLYS